MQHSSFSQQTFPSAPQGILHTHLQIVLSHSYRLSDSSRPSGGSFDRHAHLTKERVLAHPLSHSTHSISEPLEDVGHSQLHGGMPNSWITLPINPPDHMRALGWASSQHCMHTFSSSDILEPGVLGRTCSTQLLRSQSLLSPEHSEHLQVSSFSPAPSIPEGSPDTLLMQFFFWTIEVTSMVNTIASSR